MSSFNLLRTSLRSPVASAAIRRSAITLSPRFYSAKVESESTEKVEIDAHAVALEAKDKTIAELKVSRPLFDPS